MIAKTARLAWLLFFLALTLSGNAQPDLLDFHNAARRGELEVVKRGLARGLSPSTPDANGDSAVHAAAEGGRVEVLRLLLANGGPVDLPNRQGLRPLYLAASADSAECCLLLLDRGADAEASSASGWTALEAALSWGKSRAALALLDAGARAELPKGETGQTSLMTASQRGPVEVVSALLIRGANPDRTDPDGRTALHYAARGNLPDVARVLLHAGADAETRDQNGWSALDVAFQQQSREVAHVLTSSVADPSAALPGACGWGFPEDVYRLLLAGANPASKSAGGQSCLTLAAGRGYTPLPDRAVGGPLPDPNSRAIIEMLIKEGASFSTDGPEAMFAACHARNLPALRLILKAGIDPGQASAEGDYTILIAAEEGQVELFDALIVAGVDPSVRDSMGRGAAERLRDRIQALQASLERYSQMPDAHPEQVAADYELQRMQAARAQILRRLR